MVSLFSVFSFAEEPEDSTNGRSAGGQRAYLVRLEEQAMLQICAKTNPNELPGHIDELRDQLERGDRETDEFRDHLREIIVKHDRWTLDHPEALKNYQNYQIQEAELLQSGLIIAGCHASLDAQRESLDEVIIENQRKREAKKFCIDKAEETFDVLAMCLGAVTNIKERVDSIDQTLMIYEIGAINEEKSPGQTP